MKSPTKFMAQGFNHENVLILMLKYSAENLAMIKCHVNTMWLNEFNLDSYAYC